ncbi:L-histidine N(alpha)-methyltransferase [Reyranella sp. CPCC 100927]|uniref:L-histidine N(alpha)-methyltransferase n=1 Tax=Reyranella sp. CPCC 100927 TaxID=2599616 RepID=UPI0011B5B604|nr:L-histidine N(alpha)-methyltransferase [Reyranella sp. CPCC 100927]TWS98525.1 L-histidine N(alpha)-methyltransferase [Reyranella sp. CPCC 100927]
MYSGLPLKIGRTASDGTFEADVLAGLSKRPRAIPAKFLYDAQGSALFDAICELPEYYLTRTEIAILRDGVHQIAARAGAGRQLVEFGSGSSVKTRLLLDGLADVSAYVPIDISGEHLEATCRRLRADYPALAIVPVCADYMELPLLPWLPGAAGAAKLGFFPGSTIGNLEPHEAQAFLVNARHLLGDDGALVVGADLKKDPDMLHAAYNDSAGVTAAFSLNLLTRMNRELGANFDIGAFEHDAFYNSDEGRIEIYIRSLRSQSIVVAGQRFFFEAGERIHTEYSYKYSLGDVDALAAPTGFIRAQTWTDPDELFSVHYLAAV